MNISVSYIEPESKDSMRAKNLAQHGFGRIASEASKMAKAITDMNKLVRRAKAVANTWREYENGQFFDDAWTPFEDALRRHNFSDSEIDMIRGEKSTRKQVQAKGSGDDYKDIKW